MNKRILSLFVVVCVAVINAKALNADDALYDADDALYDADEALDDTDVAQAAGLVFPRDCRRRTLVRYARRCDLKVSRRVRWYIVRDPDTNKRITVIPRRVRRNRRCRRIIKRLNNRCQGTITTAQPPTTEASAEYYGEPEYFKQNEKAGTDTQNQLYETYDHKEY